MPGRVWRKGNLPLIPYTVGVNVNWYNHYGEQYGSSIKKLKIELPYDPAIPLLGIYPDKTIIEKIHAPYVHNSRIHNSQDLEAT